MLVKKQKLRRNNGRHEQRERLALAAGEQSDRLRESVLKSHIQKCKLFAEHCTVGLCYV